MAKLKSTSIDGNLVVKDSLVLKDTQESTEFTDSDFAIYITKTADPTNPGHYNSTLKNANFTTTNAEATDEEADTFTITYVDGVIQDSKGKISNTRKTTTISSGTTQQGAFSFNGADNISIYNLGTTGTPTFSTVYTTGTITAHGRVYCDCGATISGGGETGTVILDNLSVGAELGPANSTFNGDVTITGNINLPNNDLQLADNLEEGTLTQDQYDLLVLNSARAILYKGRRLNFVIKTDEYIYYAYNCNGSETGIIIYNNKTWKSNYFQISICGCSEVISDFGQNIKFLSSTLYHQIDNYDGFNDLNGVVTLNLPGCSYLANGCFTDNDTVSNVQVINCLSAGGHLFYKLNRESGFPITFFSANNLLTLGSGAFKGCTNLKEVYIPRVTIINEETFAKCNSLETIDCYSCEIINKSAFFNCNSLSSITGVNCKTISSGAFTRAGLINIKSTNFPQCSVIKNAAFQRCTSLRTAAFPAVTIIDDEAFKQCYNLEILNFPNCEAIGGSAFASCSALLNATFPKCKTIGSYAFESATSLAWLSFENCRSIASYAFKSCGRLSKIYLGNKPPEVADRYLFSGTMIGFGTGTIYVHSAYFAMYKMDNFWKDFESMLSTY